MKSKNERIYELLESNRDIILGDDKKNAICFDGIVNEECFEKAKYPIMVLLKETNGEPSRGEEFTGYKDWNYIEWIKNQQADGIPEDSKTNDPFYTYTYRKLCLLLAILEDVLKNQDVDIDNYFLNGSVNVEKVRKVLHNVSIVNLKKTWGKSKTYFENLERYLEKEKESNERVSLLKKEIEIISPKIVICGSNDVFYFANKLLAEESAELRTDKFILFNGTLYINFYHPAYTYISDKNYAEKALETFKNSKKYI